MARSDLNVQNHEPLPPVAGRKHALVRFADSPYTRLLIGFAASAAALTEII